MAKLIFYLIIYILISYISLAQHPINYQAIARDSKGELLKEKQITVRFSIIQDSLNGRVVYIEKHSITTNQFGLFNISIGSGNIDAGSYETIDWSNKYFLKIELDPAGGSSFFEVTTNEFLAVPYALHSFSTQNINDKDQDPFNEIQTLSINGNQLSISSGNSVTLPNTSGSEGDNWGTQTVATDFPLEGKGIVNDELRISGNNAKVGQFLTWTGEAWLPRTHLDDDIDSTNELQSLTFNNDTLYLSNGGGGVRIAKGAEVLNDLTDAKTDNRSIFIGNGSGVNDDGDNRNTSIGIGSLYNNNIGQYNQAVGYHALYNNSSGGGNVAIGHEALFGNTDEWENIGIGTYSLRNNNGGQRNLSIGGFSLYENVNGSYNTSVGGLSLHDNTSGKHNTAVGYQAIDSNTIGDYNTGIGMHALGNNVSGNNNTAIGYQSGPLSTSLSNSGAFGYNAIPTASNQIRLGNVAITSIGGVVNWTNISDGRLKVDIREDVVGLDFILRLKPITYNLNRQLYGKMISNISNDALNLKSYRYSGFIAQDVELSAKEVGYNFSGVDEPKNEKDLYGLRYAEFVVPLVKAIQEQQELIKKLKIQIESLREEIEIIKNETK